VVELSVRAWQPVFDSFRELLGPRLFERLYPDWRSDQATVGTGGDPGHAPARRTYEAAGFTPWPHVTYVKLPD
jgi:hypothetical protein